MRVLIDHKTLKSLFADVYNDKAKLITQIQNRYAIEGYTPKAVEVENGIEIIIDNKALEEQASAHAKAVKAAEQGNYQKAIATLRPIIDKGTLNSEVYRVYAQTLIESGASDGYDELIDALVRNPENEHALVLMGNHFANLGDNKTAKIYFNKAINENPEHTQALSNLAGILAKEENYSEAQSYFEIVIQQEPSFANAHFGLALSWHKQGDYFKAFDCCIAAFKHVTDNYFYKQLEELCNQAALNYTEQFNWQALIDKEISSLENITGKTINMEQVPSLASDAKLIVSEYRNTPNHILQYRENSPFIGHLLLHELYHLKLIHEARTAGENKVFTSLNSHVEAFNRFMKPARAKMNKRHIAQDKQDGFINSIYKGLGSQTYNAPIDLFIEQYIYNDYPQLRPVQFLSLLKLAKDAIEGPKSVLIQELTPHLLMQANVAQSMTHAMLFTQLYNYSYISQFGFNQYLAKAKALFHHYLQMANDREPGEEYDLIEWWMEDLGINHFFEQQNEPNQSTTKTTKSVDDILSLIEKDPTEALLSLQNGNEELTKFMANHGKEINPAVLMYMLSAIKYFSAMATEKVKEIAHQIAFIGATGISPEKDNYTVPAIKGKTFSGYHLLAYYYLSWAIAEPKMLQKLGLPFDKEYEMALKMGSD